jgi:hypothetical protein
VILTRKVVYQVVLVVFGWFLGGFWVVFAKTTFGKIKSSGFSQPCNILSKVVSNIRGFHFERQQLS